MCKAESVTDATLVNLRGYTFPAFDISLQRKAFQSSGDFVYQAEREVRVDDDGRQWFHQSLIAPHIIDYFLQDLSAYYAVVDRRIADYAKIRTFVEEASTLMSLHVACGSKQRRALALLCDSYILALKSVVIANLAVEDVYGRFENLVRSLLPKQRANRYLAEVVSCPAAKIAADLGFFEDTRGTKRIRDVKSEPVKIFAEHTTFASSDVDSEVAKRAVAAGVKLPHFWGLRVIAPLTVQFCEEFRYADYSIRTHLKKCLERTSELYLKGEDVYDHSYTDVLAMMAEASND